MSEVTMRYFVAEGPRAEQVAAEGLAKANDAIAKRRAYLDELGAHAFFERNHQAPYAVAFSAKDGGEKRHGFLSPTVEYHDGERYLIYKPDMRTTAGKEIKQRLGELATFNFSDFVCKEFGVSHSTIGAHRASRSGLAMYNSVAGYLRNTLVFKIPFGGDQGGGRVIDIEAPADLREIKHSEFIAITEGEKS